jgi:hypothetical protein
MGEALRMNKRFVEHVAEQLEMDCLIFLNGQVMAFALLLTVFLSDAALPEMIDDLVDIVSADLVIVKNSDNLLLLIQSNL